MTRRIVTFVILLVLSLSAALLAQQPAKKSPPAKAAAASESVKRGKKIYDDFCLICHSDTSTAKKIGAGLKGLNARGKFADGKKVDDAGWRHWIEEGGKDMPGFKDSLNAEQIRDLIVYLKTL